MERKSNFFICNRCNNLVAMIQSSGERMSCCGEPMANMEPEYVEIGAEKHKPVVEQRGSEVRVNVGSVYHPMTEEHNIGWVYLVTNMGVHRKLLIHGQPPVAVFSLANETPVAAYAYCNKHGLWKTQIMEKSAKNV